VIAGLRRIHRRAAAALCLSVPLLLAAALLGRAPRLDTHAAHDGSLVEHATWTRVPGTHVGASIGVLGVRLATDGERVVALERAPGVELPDVLLYAAALPAPLGGDLPLEVRHLGPAHESGRPVEVSIPQDLAWRHVAAFSLAEQRVLATFELPTAAELLR
jgi:hypothetical protein